VRKRSYTQPLPRHLLHRIPQKLHNIPRNGAERVKEAEGVDAEMVNEFYKEGALSFCIACAGKHFSATGVLVFEGDCGCICHRWK